MKPLANLLGGMAVMIAAWMVMLLPFAVALALVVLAYRTIVSLSCGS